MQSKPANTQRAFQLIQRCVQNFSLDLTSLTVLTEAASGAYLYTPLIASAAGAKKVYAIAKSSEFGSAEEIAQKTAQVAKEFGLAKNLEILTEKSMQALRESNIVTNTGNIRPIDQEMISAMAETAVVPLMWETWEFRNQEVDLEACKRKGIVVLGTDESREPINMFPYVGFMATKLLFELGLEGYKTRVMLLGGGGLGANIYAHMSKLGMEVSWFSDGGEAGAKPYKELANFFATNGEGLDAILIAEHSNPISLISSQGLLNWDSIKSKNPSISIGMIAGNIDGLRLAESGLNFIPSTIRPFRYMSYQPYHLGMLPILELFSAGLLVGQTMARARNKGLSPEETVAYTIQNSPAMDFKGGLAWIPKQG
jgi:hypothetical protein